MIPLCEAQTSSIAGSARLPPSHTRGGRGAGGGPRGASGLLGGGEAGLPGAVVWVGSGACPTAGLASATTAGDGSYQFTGLGAGTYCVWVDPARGPAGR